MRKNKLVTFFISTLILIGCTNTNNQNNNPPETQKEYVKGRVIYDKWNNIEGENGYPDTNAVALYYADINCDGVEEKMSINSMMTSGVARYGFQILDGKTNEVIESLQAEPLKDNYFTFSLVDGIFVINYMMPPALGAGNARQEKNCRFVVNKNNEICREYEYLPFAPVALDFILIKSDTPDIRDVDNWIDPVKDHSISDDYEVYELERGANYYASFMLFYSGSLSLNTTYINDCFEIENNEFYKFSYVKNESEGSWIVFYYHIDSFDRNETLDVSLKNSNLAMSINLKTVVV